MICHFYLLIAFQSAFAVREQIVNDTLFGDCEQVYNFSSFSLDVSVTTQSKVLFLHTFNVVENLSLNSKLRVSVVDS